MRVDRTLERIATAFAEAIVAGRFDEAEGWLAVARLTADRACYHEPQVIRPWSGGQPVQQA